MKLYYVEVEDLSGGVGHGLEPVKLGYMHFKDIGKVIPYLKQWLAERGFVHGLERMPKWPKLGRYYDCLSFGFEVSKVKTED